MPVGLGVAGDRGAFGSGEGHGNGHVVAQGASLLVPAEGDMALALSMGEPRPMEMRASIGLFDGGEGAGAV
jgi:hypothetical protein